MRKMMKPVLAAAILAFSASSPAHAANILLSPRLGPAAVVDPSCAVSTDPAETPARIGADSSDLAGQCLDSTIYRPPVELQMDEASNTLTFKNYHYKDGFWTATVPTGTGAVADAIVEVKKFAVGMVMAAHVHLRFRMAPGQMITLVNQVTNETAQTDDLAVSWEAGLVKGVPFNVGKAATPVNPIIGRVGETLTIFNEAPRPNMEQYVLNLTPDERILLMKNSLQQAADEGVKTWYNTLHPNCTTEVFDQLDALPRLKGKIDRFVVSASLDPVAGPTIQALVARNLILKRIQNFEDEIKGVTATLRIPETATQLPPFLPSVSNFPWSVVVVNPDFNTVTPSEREALHALKRDLMVHIFKVLTGYMASKMVQEKVDNKVAASLLMKVIKSSQDDLSDLFLKYKDQLPEQERLISVYFAPYAGAQKGTSLAKYGLDVSVPFPLIEERYNAQSYGAIRAYKEILRGTLQAAERGQNTKIPAYLLGLGLTVHVRKNASFAALQVMSGLNPKTKLMEQSDKQVDIHQFQIPDVSYAENIPTAVLTSFVPMPLPANFAPKLQIDFGAVGKIVDRDEPNKTWGLLQVRSPLVGTKEAAGRGDHQLCLQRTISTPLLVGNLGEEALDAKSVLGKVFNPMVDGSRIFFKILCATVDLRSAQVLDVDVRTDVPPAYCLSLDEVSAKFAKRANAKITDAVQAQSLDLKRLVMKYLRGPLNELNKAVSN